MLKCAASAKSKLKYARTLTKLYFKLLVTGQWFERDPDEEDTEYRIQQLKFSGDYNYFQGNFEAATSKYQELLGIFSFELCSIFKTVLHFVQVDSLILANKWFGNSKTRSWFH